MSVLLAWSHPMSDAINSLNAALEGRYRVERELGEGGMATVYLADDVRHERRVALKVLKPELAAVVGAERFLTEIKTTANLQHPHILPLFDSGEAEGFLYYVMPYIEGETLRDRIDREHQLPVEGALSIATAVADALHAAHEEGIVHRDIKPGNILLGRGGPLVADFGIALAMDAAGGNRLTETGLSVGTPYYMSPEQATGDQVVGPASDTYALGCVLYEMLVGEPPYVGSSAQAVLGKIIQGRLAQPAKIRPTIPANVDAAIRKALEKLPADRFPDADDFARALEDPSFRYGEADAGAATIGFGAWRRLGPLIAGLAAILAVVAAWGWLRPPPTGPVTRYGLAFAPGQEVVDMVVGSSFSVAQGGGAIVYVGPGESGARQLWVKERSELSARPLPDTEGARSPAVSPDGTRVAFEQTGRLRLIPLRGGGAITLADTNQASIEWLSEHELLFVDEAFGIRRVPVGGGTSDVVVSPASLGGRAAYHPNPLPDGRGFLFATCSSTSACSDPEVWIHDLDSAESRALVPGAVEGWFVASGHVVFVRGDGAAFALPFDLGPLEATGPAFPVLEDVKIDAVVPDLDVAPDGTVLMMTRAGGGPGHTREVVAVSRDGRVSPVDPDWRFQRARNDGWTLSPDGTRLAIGLSTDEGDDIWVKELPTGPLVRLTYDPSEDYRPYWSPDGDSIYFLGRRRDGIGDLYVRRADGADEVRRVLEVERSLWSLTWTPDREWLVARAGGITGQSNVVAYRMSADAAQADSGRIELLASEYDAVSPALSPDGRWLAYASEESGEWEVYVRPFPDVTSGRVQVSREGGHGPMWAHSGEELFYISLEGQMISASVEIGASFSVQERRALFELPPGTRSSVLHPTYDVTPDDQEFILVRATGIEVDRDAPLVLIENWLEEIEARGGG